MSVKKYDKKLAEDAAKRFRMLCEYTFNITEDDAEENVPQEDFDGGDMNQDMTSNGDMSVNGENDMMGGGDMNQDMTPNGDMSVNGENDMMGGGEQETPQEGAPGFNPSDDYEFGDSNTEQMQSDDEVIDVDDLTKSQEETEEKVDDISVSIEDGFEKLLKVVSKLDKMIDVSTNNMEQIKQEIEKRNPTPLEKLNMRAANDSYPFNVSPSDYWKSKEASSNYRIGGEDEDDAKQYTITQGDIDSITDFNTISKELNSSEFNQNLLNIFGLR